MSGRANFSDSFRNMKGFSLLEITIVLILTGILVLMGAYVWLNYKRYEIANRNTQSELLTLQLMDRALFQYTIRSNSIVFQPPLVVGEDAKGTIVFIAECKDSSIVIQQPIYQLYKMPYKFAVDYRSPLHWRLNVFTDSMSPAVTFDYRCPQHSTAKPTIR